jgi:hypothetical protein
VKLILIYSCIQLSESRWVHCVTLIVVCRLTLMSDFLEPVTAVVNSRLCWIEVLESLDECRAKPETIVTVISYQKFQT